MSLENAIALARIQLDDAPAGWVVAISTPYLFNERHAYVALDFEADTMTRVYCAENKFPSEETAFLYRPLLHTPYVPRLSDLQNPDWFSLGLLRK